MARSWSLPMRNRPWFWLPIVTRWTRTETGYKAGEIRRIKVEVLDLPSLENLSEEEAWLMNGLVAWEVQQQEQAEREMRRKHGSTSS